jgi:hypothetical protein
MFSQTAGVIAILGALTSLIGGGALLSNPGQEAASSISSSAQGTVSVEGTMPGSGVIPSDTGVEAELAAGSLEVQSQVEGGVHVEPSSSGPITTPLPGDIPGPVVAIPEVDVAESGENSTRAGGSGSCTASLDGFDGAIGCVLSAGQSTGIEQAGAEASSLQSAALAQGSLDGASVAAVVAGSQRAGSR